MAASKDPVLLEEFAETSYTDDGIITAIRRLMSDIELAVELLERIVDDINKSVKAARSDSIAFR